MTKEVTKTKRQGRDTCRRPKIQSFKEHRYNILQRLLIVLKVSIIPFPLQTPKEAWRNPAPSRAVFFVWSAALGKILTLDNLRRRHVIVVDRCCMYKRSEESIEHLLLHCDVAFSIWIAFFNHFGLSWVMPSCVVDLFHCW
jgi:hypothetical protein